MPEHAASAGKAATASFASRGSINVRLGEKVNLEALQSIVARIVQLNGCTACGLLGIDLTLGGDPVEFHQIGQLPGVRSVGFGG
jgi:hypothetical protein